MNNREQWGGLFWLGISIIVCISAMQNEIGTLRYPGPGFFPFLSGAIMGTFGIILVVISSLKKKCRGETTDLWKGLRWNKVIWVLLSLFLYCLILPTMGYLITTSVLMAFLMVFLSGIMQRWIICVYGGISFLIGLSWDALMTFIKKKTNILNP